MKALVATCMLLIACADSDGPLAPETGELDGVWTFEQIVRNHTEAVACVLKGTVRLTQHGGEVGGDVSPAYSNCVFLIDGGAPGGPLFGEAPIDFGRVLRPIDGSGGTLRMQSDACTYTGTGTGSPAHRIDGTVSCTLTIAGEYDGVPVVGDWHATR